MPRAREECAEFAAYQARTENADAHDGLSSIHPAARPLGIINATKQSIPTAESAIFMLIRKARTGAADAGSCTDSQRAIEKRGGKERGGEKALGWAKPLAERLAAGGMGTCGRRSSQRRRAQWPRRRRPAKGSGHAFIPALAAARRAFI